MGHASKVSTLTDYEQLLRSSDLRVTRPRVAVLSAVHEHPHADTDSIIGAVRQSLAEVSHQAVYDVLRALTAAGLVRRIQPSGSVARYESRVGDNHHHVICRSCGSIADVDCAVGDAPCLHASNDHGYTIDEAEVIYWGRCPDCAGSDVSQVDGDHSPVMNELRDEMLCPSDTSLLSPSNDRPLSTPTPSPEEWLAPALLTPITVLKAARIGSGGLGANAGWARHDVADATFTGIGQHLFR